MRQTIRNTNPRACRGCQKSYTPSTIPNSNVQKYCSVECRERWRTQGSNRVYQGLATGTIGAIGELRVCADLLAKGYEVFRSVSPSCSCDLLILRNGTSTRIEVKTAYMGKSGKIHYPSANVRADIVAAVLADEIVYIPSLEAL